MRATNESRRDCLISRSASATGSPSHTANAPAGAAEFGGRRIPAPLRGAGSFGCGIPAVLAALHRRLISGSPSGTHRDGLPLVFCGSRMALPASTTLARRSMMEGTRGRIWQNWQSWRRRRNNSSAGLGGLGSSESFLSTENSRSISLCIRKRHLHDANIHPPTTPARLRDGRILGDY